MDDKEIMQSITVKDGKIYIEGVAYTLDFFRRMSAIRESLEIAYFRFERREVDKEGVTFSEVWLRDIKDDDIRAQMEKRFEGIKKYYEDTIRSLRNQYER